MPQFYKMLANNMWHNDFRYQEGLNVDTLPFNPEGSCQPGGLYYTTLEYLATHHNMHWNLIADVEVPDDARVYAEPCGTKWKADRIILHNIRPLNEFLSTLDQATLCQMVARNGNLLSYVDNQTEEICLAAVNRYGCALQFVKNQTEAVCLAAVQQDGLALQFVNHPTDAVNLAAVQQNGYAIRDVPRKTHALSLAAVQQNPFVVYWIRDQTEEICLAAVQRDGRALEHVRHPTEAVCRAAVAQNPNAKVFCEHILQNSGGTP
jgi:hypothetical protein